MGGLGGGNPRIIVREREKKHAQVDNEREFSERSIPCSWAVGKREYKNLGDSRMVLIDTEILTNTEKKR